MTHTALLAFSHGNKFVLCSGLWVKESTDTDHSFVEIPLTLDKDALSDLGASEELCVHQMG